jgi:hypothetical protein
MFEEITDNEVGKPYLGTNHYFNTNIIWLIIKVT